MSSNMTKGSKPREVTWSWLAEPFRLRTMYLIRYVNRRLDALDGGGVPCPGFVGGAACSTAVPDAMEDPGID
jgi:hypothetical protein